MFPLDLAPAVDSTLVSAYVCAHCKALSCLTLRIGLELIAEDVKV